ncbi:uncharacterized protein LOC108451682 [Gossypium arboreum]|uniref:uncharacterized protein LOC108451682 n=1 Tax=Gossypium arboreum TaxID=29729 RepID=UPI0008194102|nr:uncharacterized protein LOC108451682 [Gossypium arboreum]
MRQHAEESTKKYKALACLQSGVSDVIFTRIMACSTPKEAWERLREEFMGSDKTRQQQVINLKRDFENLKIKESKTIKQYSDRIMATVNSIRLLGEDFNESTVVEKVITTLLERFESKISSLEDSRDLTTISLSELTKHSVYSCKKFGHIKKVCKKKGKAPAQQQIQAQAADDLQAQEEHAFTASCSATLNKARCNWLVESGCTHHMAADKKLFKDLDRTFVSKIRIGNGNMIEAKGRGNVVINIGSVEDMSKLEAKDTICEVCQLGKQARLPFPANMKSEVFNAFSKFKALVENQSGCKIKALRTDNGTEYLSERFQRFCKQAGIHHQLTTVYTP